MTLIDLFMFLLSTAGMSHIIVDSSLLETFRINFKKLMVLIKKDYLGNLVDCYMCSGTWTGFLMGYIWISEDPLKIFACGCAGGLISSLFSNITNLLESLTIVNLGEE